jgi:hypothetical protein
MEPQARALSASLGVAAGLVMVSAACPARAQPSVSASVDRQTVAADQTLTLTIRVSGTDQVEEPQIGALEDFLVVSQFRSQSVNIAGGRTSVDVSFQYVLQPRSEGTKTIPAIEVVAGGRALKTRPLTVEVSPATGAAPAQRLPSQPPVPPPRLSPFLGPDEVQGHVVVRCEADKKQAYVGEQILLTFSLYYSARPGEINYEPAGTEGFRVQELSPPPPRYEVIDGERYVLKQDLRLLFPTAPGQHTIGPATVQYSRGFWNPTVETRTTEPITIQVSRLPEAGRPESFSGVVGSLEVAAVLDRDRIKQGEAATLTAVVRGWGNLEAMGAPVISLPPGVREYRSSEDRRFEPKPADGGYRVEGEAHFDNVIIPTTLGDITIPPIRIGYFDPQTDGYRVARSDPVVLHVEAGEPGVALGVEKADQGGRLRPLPGRLVDRSDRLLLSPLVVVSQIGAVAWLIGAALLRRRRTVLERNPRLAKARRAARAAAERIREARRRSPREAAAGMAVALAGYVADKLDVPPATVSPASAPEMLASHGIGSHGEELTQLLKACDSVRFSPQPEADVGAIADRALQLIRSLEREIGRGPNRKERSEERPQ